MKILPVQWSKTGRGDLRRIHDDIAAAASRNTAFAYVARIEARCRRIGDAPRSGRRRDDLLPGLRTIAFERSALICYIVSNDRVWITNVLRAGRDFEAILRGDAPTDDPAAA